MAFNVAKVASARSSLTISLTKSLRVAGPLVRASAIPRGMMMMNNLPCQTRRRHLIILTQIHRQYSAADPIRRLQNNEIRQPSFRESVRRRNAGNTGAHYNDFRRFSNVSRRAVARKVGHLRQRNKAAGYAILSVSCSRTILIPPPLFSPIIRTPHAAASARMSPRLRTSQTDCE